VKRSLMLFLVSAMLIGSLTGCGCASKDAGTAQNGNSTTTEDTQSGASTNDPAGSNGSGSSAQDQPGNGTDGANTGDSNTIGSGESGSSSSGGSGDSIMNDVGDAITGNDTTDGGVAIDDMLRNGRVCDN